LYHKIGERVGSLRIAGYDVADLGNQGTAGNFFDDVVRGQFIV
jgi:methanogenic corrinoid protein MtbC1